MVRQIENIRRVRLSLIERLKYVSHDELNCITHGFNNNIIWNLGHVIAVQQGICYKKTGATPLISDDFFEKYKPGSMPKAPINNDEMDHIKSLLIRSMDQLGADYNTAAFDNYAVWTTAYGFEIQNIDDALHFESFHEGLHFGIITTMIKMLRPQKKTEIL